MSNIAHHDRIQVFVFALSAKDKKNVSALANSPSIFLKHMEVRMEYYYRIHSKPSCFIASNKWDARSYRHISLTRVASHLARSDWADSSGNFCLAKFAKDSTFLLAF